MVEFFGLYWHPVTLYVVVALISFGLIGFVVNLVDNGGRNGR